MSAPEDAVPGSGPAVEGGELVVAALRRAGVDTLFTLSGGHVFAILHAANEAGMRIVDVRHEQTAAFAAEGLAKLTRRPGVAVLTAGPGVTNGVSALATAWFNGSPLVVLGGRASGRSWGRGSLQELDHVPIVDSVTKHATTVTHPDLIPDAVRKTLETAATPHRGPAFLDLPIDVLHSRSSAEVQPPSAERSVRADPDDIAEAASIAAGAERPVLVAGGDVWWGVAWEALRRCVENLRVPTFTNGQGRGCLPADHELALARVRKAVREADVVVVVGTPLDFRLSAGRFGAAEVVHIVDDPGQRARHVPIASAPAGDLAEILDGMAAWRGPREDHEPWIERLRDWEREQRERDESLLRSDSEVIHPARVIGEVRARLDRGAVVIGDGGDFVSYAGRFLDSYQPGRWLDPGPFGCLGHGIGYAAAARLCHPDGQVVLLVGDGALGFSVAELDTLVRHRLPVVIVVGNNGIWGLEKHPMRELYGSDVAADLSPGCRYDELARSLGAAGELVERPTELAPALRRAFASDVPYLLNVLTDPTIAYQRSTKLG